ncbi:MAG: peptidase [Hydrocarboniphaga sp.]|uniref:CocE/NonD family hydrolase n=1 Tax=Hydrocarboniphaga sp. TaxID=2033016 RepID=UPI00260308C5|nr:CocE/NonD family hydrolase [Hydrocarboniphaga sp.]MDB5971249.1 peptidase [Hydrocarboniphaga sp.]
MTARLAQSLRFLLLMIASAPAAALAQNFDFKAPASAVDPNTPAVMRDLAERVLPVYQDADIERYLATLSALQLVAGNYLAANDTRQILADRRRAIDAGRAPGRSLLIDLYAHAKAIETGDAVPFAQAFTESFRDVVPKLGDRDAYTVTSWMHTPLSSYQDALQRSFDRQRTRPGVSQAEAIELIRSYLSFAAYRSFGSLADSLAAEDDAQRYVVEESVPIKGAGGARLYARLVRPKNAPGRLPALLEFTIFVTQDDARAAASHGYVGIVAYARGKNPPVDDAAPGNSKARSARFVPFQHDGEDARAVIQWITAQPWSDGRVGMIGGGYSGFAAWAAAKRMPAALKAIATSDAMAPGISFPSEGRVFKNSSLRWAYTNVHGVDDISRDEARWAALDQAWYKSGKAYRSLDRVAKLPDAAVGSVFRTWLTHPSYDRWWQKYVPYREQFAKLDIPVLSTAGYYSSAEVGALYYFSEHLRYKPDANHTLLIGPYDNATVLARPAGALRGYTVDNAALIDLRELRLDWFDSVFKAAGRPALLKDRINYQLMGANEWRHAPTIAAMANATLKLYLDIADKSGQPRLSSKLPADTQLIEQTVKLADRSIVTQPPTTDILSRNLPLNDALGFVSEPLKEATEISGLLSGQLDFVMNRQDLDLNVTLYELMANGDYLQLADPYEFRASYAADQASRHLLRAGERQLLKFSSEQLGSRRLQAGSRVVLVLGVNQRPDREINYGSGKNVGEETLADGKPPLRIRWYGGSYIELPVRK